jgi:CBS domain-containing protein
MAKSALSFRPPNGLLLRLRGTTVDLKVQGISPVVFLARCYALEVASPARNTLARLEAAVAAGLLEKDGFATLSEVYRFLLRLRLREQIRMSSEGRTPVNQIALSELSSIERSRLKDAFRAIEVWQERATVHYRAHFF